MGENSKNPTRESLAQEWIDARKFIDLFKKIVSKQFLIVGGIVSVEPHKNSSLKKKGSKNTKAGKPHFHMVLWFCHEFLNPSIEKLKLLLLQLGTNSQIKKLETNLDVLKTGLYSTKDKGNLDLKKICNFYMQWPANINIWINQEETSFAFNMILKALPKDTAFASYEDYMDFPVARKFTDETLLLHEIFYKMFLKLNLAVRDKMVYRKIEGTQFSWERWMSLEQWIANCFQLHRTVGYLQMLKESAFWISQEGQIRSSGPKFELFPHLLIQLFLVEFKDCLYEFSRGTTQSKQEVAPETSTVCYVNTDFDNCEPPFTLLGLVHMLICLGKNILPEKESLQLIPPKKLNKSQKVSLKQMRQFEDRFCEALSAFGGMYHPTLNRKKNPALFLTGEPSTYKTFLINTLLGKLVGLDHCDIISRHNSRFSFEHLQKEDDLYFMLLMDDFSWENPGMFPGDMINLLDNNPIFIDKKFKTGVAKKLAGSMVFTSNEPLYNENISKTMNNALAKRIHEVPFHPIKETIFNLEDKFIKQIEKEALGFSILSNAFFLSKNSIIKKNLRLPKSFFKTPNGDDKKNILEYAGIHHMKNILDFICY